jgi:hypothetical protein
MAFDTFFFSLRIKSMVGEIAPSKFGDPKSWEDRRREMVGVSILRVNTLPATCNKTCSRAMYKAMISSQVDVEEEYQPAFA